MPSTDYFLMSANSLDGMFDDHLHSSLLIPSVFDDFPAADLDDPQIFIKSSTNDPSTAAMLAPPHSGMAAPSNGSAAKMAGANPAFNSVHFQLAPAQRSFNNGTHGNGMADQQSLVSAPTYAPATSSASGIGGNQPDWWVQPGANGGYPYGYMNPGSSMNTIMTSMITGGYNQLQHPQSASYGPASSSMANTANGFPMAMMMMGQQPSLQQAPPPSSSTPAIHLPAQTIKVPIATRRSSLPSSKKTTPLMLPFHHKNDNRIIPQRNFSPQTHHHNAVYHNSYNHQFTSHPSPSPFSSFFQSNPLFSINEIQNTKKEFLHRAESFDYSNVTVVELKNFLRDFHQASGGKKADLVERIQYICNYLREEAAVVAANSAQGVPPNVDMYMHYPAASAASMTPTTNFRSDSPSSPSTMANDPSPYVDQYTQGGMSQGTMSMSSPLCNIFSYPGVEFSSPCSNGAPLPLSGTPWDPSV